jgi:hypothetical protein
MVAGGQIDLLHDARLSLGESDVTARFVLNEFNLNLSPLAAALLIVVVVVVACRRHSRAFCASRLEPVAGEVVARGRVIEGVRIGDVGHVGRTNLSLMEVWTG